MEDILQIIRSSKYVITYDAFRDEPDLSASGLMDGLSGTMLTVPKEKNQDPFCYAERCIETVGADDACVLVPGQMFDSHGGRKGRGAGWYDRFLSKVPKDWIRIGVLTEDKLSSIAIGQNEWDQPMDWLIVFDGGGSLNGLKVLHKFP